MRAAETKVSYGNILVHTVIPVQTSALILIKLSFVHIQLQLSWDFTWEFPLHIDMKFV